MPVLSPHLEPQVPDSACGQRPNATVGARIWLAGCVLVAFGLLAWGYLSPTHPHVKETRIDKIQVGSWVLAGNPTGEKDLQFGTEVDEHTWRKLTLTASKKDGSIADVTLLRPTWWLEKQEAKHGGRIEISVPECGIEGIARIHAIEPCPSIKPRPGPEFQVVTATFKHQAARVVDIYFDVAKEPIGTTPNHPFWNESKQTFARADELMPGDRLRQFNGQLTTVVRTAPRGQLEMVFNIEVGVDHVYHITSSGILVHNGGVTDFPCDPSEFAGAGMRDRGPKLGNEQGREFRPEQLDLIELDPNTPSHVKGWIRQERNRIARGQSGTIRMPPGYELGHLPGKPARDGYDYSNSVLQGMDINDIDAAVSRRMGL